jgi:hypothetical protein
MGWFGSSDEGEEMFTELRRLNILVRRGAGEGFTRMPNLRFSFCCPSSLARLELNFGTSFPRLEYALFIHSSGPHIATCLFFSMSVPVVTLVSGCQLTPPLTCPTVFPCCLLALLIILYLYVSDILHILYTFN